MKNICKKSLIPALLVIILSGIARAEDVELDKIVVTPSRIEESSAGSGRTVDIVSSNEINEGGAQDLAGALTDLTSVNISSYGGPGTSKTIRIRGSTGAQVLVLMDGRPINNPRDGEVDLSNIALDDISRIEVMHGPGSSLYGSSAMGGVVNIITKNPPKEGQKVEAYSSFGTARTYNERLSYGAKVTKFGYLISGGYESSQGFRENSALNAEDSNLKLEYELNNENNLKMDSGFYKSKVGLPGSLTFFDADDKQNVMKRFFDFNWSFKPDAKTEFAIKAYQNYDRLEFIENSAGPTWGDVANQKDIHTTTVRGVDLQFNKQLLDVYSLVGGFNYVKNVNDSTSSAKHRYNVTAGYLENRLDLFDKKLNFNFSARLDDYSNFGTEINPSLSMSYKLNDDIKFHGLVSRSFRAPTFNDLYWSSPGMLNNPNLKPEKGVTGEIGIETKLNNKILFGITYYRSKYSELIQWAPLTEDPWGDWTVKNIGSAVTDGIELSNKISITDNLEADLNYTYMIAKDDKTHKFLIYQPQNKADFRLKYKDLKGFLVELKGQFVGRRFTNTNNTTSLKEFFVFGLSASKEFKPGFTCFTAIDNLLNRKYQVINDYPMPGFSFTGGLKAEF